MDNKIFVTIDARCNHENRDELFKIQWQIREHVPPTVTFFMSCLLPTGYHFIKQGYLFVLSDWDRVCSLWGRDWVEYIIWSGPGSSVGIATDYGLDGPGIESRWGEIFRLPDRPWSPPKLLYNWYQVFPGGRKRPRRDADPSPLLVPRSKIE